MASCVEAWRLNLTPVNNLLSSFHTMSVIHSGSVQFKIKYTQKMFVLQVITEIIASV